MEMVWSPKIASEAYIFTVKSCKNIVKESGVAELLSAMAAGWNAKLIVETRLHGGPIATSIGLEIAARQTGGRHVCIVPDERSRLEYIKAMKGAECGICMGEEVEVEVEVAVGEVEEAMRALEGVEFLVVDCKRRDFGRVLRLARLSKKGAVLACKNAWEKSMVTSGFPWQLGVIGRGYRVVRSVFLPVGQGLDIVYVGSSTGGGGGDGDSGGSSKRGGSNRWIKHFDHRTGEEHLFRG